MSPHARYRIKIRKLLFVLLLILIAISIFLAVRQQTPWLVPEAEKLRKNPLAPSAASMEAIKSVYREHCSECHGDSGKGDGPKAAKHNPRPTDFTHAAQLDPISDGELFYKITEGRKPMPSFRNRLTDDQRWQLVLLIRSFAHLAPAPGRQ